ncbi:NAD-dependent epimerase/dehydratase family protein [Deinococcus pimensis]|uniref:NAD-dependent epimerase/dehydratase family protein n=1 Tax=Deinococcus pimensis TaxID=309888 RepID=UPI0004BCAD29|nr:NAD-dependent epimerase/dehydratase family protein [Deinococcus pimensis]
MFTDPRSTTVRPTSPLSGTHVVLGGGGAAGRALVRELLTRGADVRVVSPREPRALPAGAHWTPGDAREAGDVARMSRNARVVYMAAQPEYTRWKTDFPPMLDAVIEGVARSQARLVFVDNLYTYGPVTGPLSETSPEHPTSRKGQVRLRMARTLLRTHEEGRVRVVIGRASDYFGPLVIGSLAGKAFFDAVLAGKRPRWFGRHDVPHALTFVDDFARALVTLGEHDEAYGRAWHVPTDEPLTGRAFAALVAREAGVADRAPATLPLPAVRTLGLFVPILRELADVAYQATGPWEVDGTRFAAAFGFRPTPNAEAVRRTVEWVRTQMEQTASAPGVTAH